MKKLDDILFLATIFIVGSFFFKASEAFAQACTGTLKCDTWNGLACEPPFYNVSCSLDGCGASCKKPACQFGGSCVGSGGGGGGSCVRSCVGACNCNKTPPGCNPITSSSCTSDADCGGCGGPPPPPPGPPPPPPSPSCSVDLTPNAPSISEGAGTTFTASVTNIQNGTVSSVNYASTNTSIVTVSPASDTTVVYNTVGTGVAVGSASVTANVIMSGSSRCSDTSPVTVTPANPWWQAGNSDIITSGDITSLVPALLRLILDGIGGYPGVAAYGGSLNTSSGSLSSKDWKVNTNFSDPRTYNYAFFEKQIPNDVTFNEIVSPTIDGSELTSGGVESRGVYWYHFDGTQGDLTITGNITILGTRRVVLMVEGANLNLNGKINIGTKGSGFFMAIAGENSSGGKGSIVVDPAVGGAADGVPELEGLFVADDTFSTGTLGANLDSQLHVRGSVASYGGMNLQRDLANDATTPAEYFEFAPELMLLYPTKLTLQRFRWEEVAP